MPVLAAVRGHYRGKEAAGIRLLRAWHHSRICAHTSCLDSREDHGAGTRRTAASLQRDEERDVEWYHETDGKEAVPGLNDMAAWCWC